MKMIKLEDGNFVPEECCSFSRNFETGEMEIDDVSLPCGCDCGHSCENCVIQKIMNEQGEQKENGWILCSERLPEECVPVNITWINRDPKPYYSKIKDVPFSATGVYCNENWYWYSSTCIDYLREYGKCEWDLIDKAIDITHWQPLPEPCKEK